MCDSYQVQFLILGFMFKGDIRLHNQKLINYYQGACVIIRPTQAIPKNHSKKKRANKKINKLAV
jgi:hypothetical protein